MSDKATLRRLLKEYYSSKATAKFLTVENQILSLFDAVRDEEYQRAEVAERDLAALKEQTRWRFDPDDTLIMGERVEILFQSQYVSIATPVNTLDADFLASKFGCRWINDAGNGCVNVEAWRPLPEPPEVE